jgi:L-gulonolactone oxidase
VKQAAWKLTILDIKMKAHVPAQRLLHDSGVYSNYYDQISFIAGKIKSLFLKTTVALSISSTLLPGGPHNTFDGPGFPACHNVSAIFRPSSIDEMATIVRAAAVLNVPVRTAGKGHMWYDTMCSDDPRTVIIQTESVHEIYDFSLEGSEGSVMIEAGVTFFELADYLHALEASLGYALVNWNMTIAGSVAMGAHRSSLREDSMVASSALEIHIIDGTGTIQKVVRNETNDDWLAASTSLGLLRPIARIKFKIFPDFKLYAQQTM